MCSTNMLNISNQVVRSTQFRLMLSYGHAINVKACVVKRNTRTTHVKSIIRN